MINVNQKRSDFQSQVLGTQTMHIHFIYEKEYFGYVTWSEFPWDFFVKYIHACHYC
jgi:hypothetical protein